ncbi:maleylpyruvate isomerase family mycothiol-dependent enzyme [Amycolatopsis anabasis]|uniref:maleylpyruvate isomerase family mycothiol-dependent enzyme n=1 Tax=Amycolatopsis anabasis TaxID=1840409 RepID=UPI00131ACFF9|nr:maleylpyruvate isomerase family mycothiol-dependent enzyme [Amycolatopsis anabasis]
MAGQALIDHGRLLDVLGIEGELLGGLAHVAPADATVPTCPGLTVGETVRHVGSVYRVVLAWLRGGNRPREWQREPGPGQSLGEYLSTGLAELLGELGEHEPDEHASTWWPADETYGFWRRRMAHETTIHRTDVQTAAGMTISEIPDDIAIDGVDEILSLWFGHRLPLLGLAGTRVGSVAVQTGGHTWIVHAGPTENVAWHCSSQEAERADATLSGFPTQVYLWLWGRASPTSVHVDGDLDAVGQLWALLRLATR